MSKVAMTPQEKAKKQQEKERLAKAEKERLAKLTPEQRSAERAKMKSDNFKRLAMQRAINVLKRLDHLQQTSNKNSYSYTSEQVDSIFSTIEKKLNEVKSSFSVTSDKGSKKDYGIVL